MTFRLDQDVAVVEHDPVTGKPRDGGRIEYGSVGGFYGGDEVHASFPDGTLPPIGTGDMFWAESGWRVRDDDRHWRLVPVCCRCENPITGIPVTAGDDPIGRQWCRDECMDAAAEASYEQRYQPGMTDA